MDYTPIIENGRTIGAITQRTNSTHALDECDRLTSSLGFIAADLPLLVRALSKPAIKDYAFNQGLDSRSIISFNFPRMGREITIRHDPIIPPGTTQERILSPVRNQEDIIEGQNLGTCYKVNIRLQERDYVEHLEALLDKDRVHDSRLAQGIVGGARSLAAAHKHQVLFDESFPGIKFESLPTPYSLCVKDKKISLNQDSTRSYLLIDPDCLR